MYIDSFHVSSVLYLLIGEGEKERDKTGRKDTLIPLWNVNIGRTLRSAVVIADQWTNKTDKKWYLMQKWCFSAEITWFPVFQLALQGGLSGRGKLLVDIEIKVPPQFKLLILKRNS